MKMLASCLSGAHVHSYGHVLRHCRRLSASPTRSRFVPTFDPYSYTQGRWLDRDEDRRRARELRFDFDALMDITVKTSKGAQQVIACEKKEGGFNRVFIVHLDNGAKVVARLPTSIAGPPRLTVSSEVATLQYVREKTRVPVPEVLAWSSEPGTGPVGAEYMIMSAVPGVALKDGWDQMTGVQHIQCIKSLGKIAKELCKLDFPAFGSLYFNTADKPTEAFPLDDRYCIGPHCASQHWGCGLGRSAALDTPERNQGPWRNLEKYFSDLTNIAKASLRDDKLRQMSVDEHLQLLDINQSTLESITDSENVQMSAQPTLFHPDFHTRNIFVASEDPTQITGIIDWQSTAIEPAFVHAAETPDFAEDLPFDRILDADRSAEMDEAQADAERCGATWAILAHICPKLGKAVENDDLLSRYLAAPSSGWLDDPVSLRSLLTDMNQKWVEFGLPGDSQYHPTQEDVDTLNVELEESQSRQRMRMYLARLLHCETDGWVEASRWEEVLPIYRSQHEQWVESCIASREEDESEEDAVKKAERLWPFDLW